MPCTTAYSTLADSKQTQIVIIGTPLRLQEGCPRIYLVNNSKSKYATVKINAGLKVAHIEHRMIETLYRHDATISLRYFPLRLMTEL